MAVFKVISVPQKYADEDAYADLLLYQAHEDAGQFH